MRPSALLPLLLPLLLLPPAAETSETPASFVCRTDAYPPPAGSELEFFDVDLDESPLTRWRPVVEARGPQIRELLTQFKEFLRNLTGSDLLIHLVDKDLVPLALTLPEPFRQELVGIAAMTGIPLGEVTLYNVFYELFPFCTSIVAEDSTGRLYHARNLDFGLLMGWDTVNNTWLIAEYLRQAVVNVRFWRDGRHVFTSTNFAGYVGAVTAMRPARFSISMNTRLKGKDGVAGVLEWLLGNRAQLWLGFALRQAAENCSDYEAAKRLLTDSPLLASAYFILGGNASMQGCVITRNRSSAVDVLERRQAVNHTWYLLQTNYDWWRPPLVIDDRRTPGNLCMRMAGQSGLGFRSLYNVLSSTPVLNKLTIYTALISVSTGEYKAFVRHCPEPCAPW